MRTITLLALVFATSVQAATQISWKRQQLHGNFYSEGAGIGDINGDGKADVVAGPFWWEGPSFEKKHAYYEPKIFNINGYSDNFFAYVHDFNADQKNDILILGFPGKEARLYLNPGTHDDKPWPMHIVADVVDNESPVFTDITGDGKPEIVCSTGGRFGWFAPNWDKPTEKWIFFPISDDMKVAKFTHGLGVGDVNGDGRLDLLEARRWWEQPDEPKGNVPFQRRLWTQHTFAAGIPGGAQMFAYDFDGNGTNDIFTTLAAHRYGIAVFLQTKNKEPGTANWKRIMLSSEQPQDNDYGIVISQPHAAHLADIDGDGIQDIVTGKRYWAHNGKDPGEQSGDRLLYWYQTKRDGKGGVDFVPHLVDANTGVGTDVQVGDLNGDKLPDILVANKAGVFILTQQRSETTADFTPRKMYGPGLMPQKDYATGQSPQDALKNMQLPTGFKAELIAHEPDLVQPIAFTFDERGRIWIIEGNSYPKPREVGQGQDRILIFEDADGDGRYETRKVFCEGINLASGIELGFGGVWVGAAPYLMFIPRDGDSTLPLDKPYERYKTYPKVPGINFTAYALLDGWGSQDTHETLNSFIWGPDGWLYGCHGVFTHSRVGRPGTPDAERQPINAGVWRYHPVRHEFEVFAHGTSNPWGLDYDQHGEWFVTACVIPHLYHIVPGGRYQRQAGQHFNVHTYEDIKTIADHAHYAGTLRPNIEFNKTTGAGLANDDTNALGGGHAHCGLAIYQSNQFPPTYRNQMIFGNLHGHRLVANYTDPKGSTYIGKHAADFMRANDMHFIPVTQKVGPDGALYVSDWSDQQICHRGSNAVEHWDRSNGRLYRITYGEQASRLLSESTGKMPVPHTFPKAPFDLAKESDETLAKLAVQTENEWFSRMARRVLMERRDIILSKLTKLSDGDIGSIIENTRIGEPMPAALQLLESLGCAPSEATHLRALWVIHCVGFFEGNKNLEQWLSISLSWGNAWRVRLAPNSALKNAAEIASKHPSPIVRRELASALQRLPIDQRQPLATALLSRAEDKDDPVIPLLVWYGIEPLVAADSEAGLKLAAASKMPKVTGFIYRRMASEPSGIQGLLKLASESSDVSLQKDLLTAVLNATRSGTKISPPANWPAMREKVASASAESQATLRELEAHMGIDSAIEHYVSLVENKQPLADVRKAIVILNAVRPSSERLRRALIDIIACTPSGSVLKRDAILSLGVVGGLGSEDFKLLAGLLSNKALIGIAELPDAINTLASTKEGAVALLKAVEAKHVPASALSPFLIRQLSAFDDAEVKALIKSAWGDVNAPKADMAERVKKYRDLLTADALAKGDLAKGKVLYMGICGACHKLFGEGQNLGPDITGSNRADLGYLLENVLDPNAVIGKDYQLNLFTMKDGRVMSGIVKEDNPTAVKVAMMGGIEFNLPVADIAKREVSKFSTMPEGLFDALKPEQVIDLVKYLQSTGTVAPDGSASSLPGALEGETLKAKASGGSVKPQKMGGFGTQWSGASQLWWAGAKEGDQLKLTLPVKEAGRYTLRIALTLAHDYGIFSATLNGAPVVSEWDGYMAGKVAHSGELDWGTHDLKPGDNELTLTLTGKHPDATPRYMVGVDYVRLEKK